MTHYLDLSTITLSKGGHETRTQGTCLTEAVAWWAGEPHSDHPACMSPVLGAFGRRLNDVLPDAQRQELIPLIPRLVGTAGDGLDERRSCMALDWLIRTHAPAWLDLAGLPDAARSLREQRRIVDMPAVEAAGPAVREAQRQAAAAGAAARDAAWAAAWDAAEGAAEGAARVTTWAVAYGAARNAVLAAVEDAAWDAVLAVVCDAVGDAAEGAVRAALQPTVDMLQRSAIQLHRDMITADEYGEAVLGWAARKRRAARAAARAGGES